MVERGSHGGCLGGGGVGFWVLVAWYGRLVRKRILMSDLG